MYTYTALCAIGAEKILGNELKHLGFKLDGNAPGRVRFVGDEEALYTANVALRTSDRVYLELANYEAADFDALFEGCYQIPWQTYLKKDSRVVVDKVRSHKSQLTSVPTVQSVVQKAIYTKLGDVWHISSFPESGAKCDVRVYIESDRAYILLDTSGEALHKRGWRTSGGIAPLRETTAAVLLQESLWRRKVPLVDPFCGSGTIAIEAALYAHDIAPGLGRTFAFDALAIFNERMLSDVLRKHAQKIRTDVECHIVGSDSDPAAVERARRNAEHAFSAAGVALQSIGSDAKIERPVFEVRDFRDARAERDGGLILCNPPYGERIGDADQAKKLYGDMAGLFDAFPGWRLGAITSHRTFEACIGRQCSVKKTLKSGNLDTTFYLF